MLRTPSFVARAGLLALVVPLVGCIGNRVIHPILPTAEQLAEFNAAGPSLDEGDPDQLIALGVGKDDYMVAAGDLLEVEVPTSVISIENAEDLTVKVRTRVQADGSIRIPTGIATKVIETNALGQTVAQIEELLATQIEQVMTSNKPTVVVTVQAYRTVTVAIFGAVKKTGILELRSDRLSLLGAIMAADGIREDGGAGTIRILTPNDKEGQPPSVQVYPVRGSTIPLQDVPLAGGETIVVEPLEDQGFTAIGLVAKPGQFTYPQNRTYNLQQALAVAGGTDDIAAPRYCTIYRRNAEDRVLTCTFKIDGTALTDASNILIKPGDVIAVEHTQGTWTRTIVSTIFGFRLSASASSSGTL